MTINNHIRATAFTGGLNVPSARFRVRELIPHLADFGVELTEEIPCISKYPPKSKLLRPLWFMAATTARIPGIIKSHNTEITLLQREFLSTLVTLEKLTSSPRVLDVDDAIHIHRNGKTAQKLASYCDIAFCGNNFLRNYYDDLNIKTALMPTGIDASRFTAKEEAHENQQPQIGWTGSSSNLKYLYQIEPALKIVLEQRPETKLSIICDESPEFTSIKPSLVNYHKWNKNNEATLLQSFDIGIMPLSNSEWERGKCAFKILQYMSCEIPVVASPVGANINILKNNEIGLSANNHDEWIETLLYFLDNKAACTYAGNNGRKKVLSEYDLPIIAKKMATEFKNLISG